MIRLPQLAALAALALLLAAPDRARAEQSFTGVSVIVGGYEVFGRLADGLQGSAAAPVSATLRAPDGLLRATATAETTDDGGFELAFVSTGLGLRQPVRIRAGDRLTLGAGTAHARDLTVPDFLVNEFEVAQEQQPLPDRVAGLLRPGTEVVVTANTLAGAFATRKAVVEPATGDWTADFTGSLDIAPGSYGVAYFQADGVTWQSDWVARHIELAVGSPEVLVHDRPGALLDLRMTPLANSAVPPSRALGAAWDRVTRLTLRRADGTPQPVLADGVLGLPNFSWRLPTFTLEVDSEAGTIGGTGEPGLRLALQLPGGSRTLAVDEDGNWRLDLPGTVLGEDTPVTVTLPDYPYLVWRAYAPRVLTLDPYAAAVTGRGTAGMPVSLRVHHAGAERGRASGTVAADGSFALAARDPAGDVVPRAAGDSWRATHGRASVAYAIPPFTATADGGNRRVSGTASPAAEVTVQVGAVVSTTVTAADGRWSTQFPADTEMPPGTPVRAGTRLLGGPETRLDFPTFRASAQLKGDRVRVEGPAGLSAEVELERDGDTLAGGRCTVERSDCLAALTTADGRPVALAPDDTVLVYPSTGATATLNLVKMTAHVDASGHDVVGEAPPDADLRIVFGHQPGAGLPLDAGTSADRTGVFDHELSASEWGALTPGLWADVFLPMTSGHLQSARGVLEVLRAVPGAAEVSGMAEPRSPVVLSLAGPGGRAAAAEVTAGPSGAFSATLRDAAGAAVPLQAGDLLRGAHARGVRQLPVSRLAAWRAGPDGAVVGVTAPGLNVRAVYQLRATPWARHPVRVDGSADAAGAFVLPAPALDPHDVAALEVVAVPADGDELLRTVPLAVAPGPLYLPLAQTPMGAP